jgi:uncharacterized cupredoxin-like copper-binding protein
VSKHRLALSLATIVVAGSWVIPATGRPTAARVNVAAGKPSEFRFTLSARSVRKGTVVFSVVNKGGIPHDFKIDGKKTPLLSPGKSAKLTVVFAKTGKYPYLCTVPGHAAAGMKGVLAVAR